MTHRTNRQLTVQRGEAGRTLAEWLHVRLELPRGTALALVRNRLVRVGGVPCLDPQRRLSQGQRVEIRLPPAGKPAGKRGEKQRPPPGPPQRVPAGPQPVVRFADEQVVVVDKPAGLTTMRHAEEADEFGARGKRFLPPTLADLLPTLLAKGRPGRQPPVRAVHRIDKETSGLVVFACTPAAERDLGKQFREHSTERVYLALVRGRAASGRIESRLVRDRGDGRRGSTTKENEGQRAVTHVRVVEELGDYTLVECRLETGRTHQVRIHLGEAGTPLCGDHIYDRPPHGKPLPDDSGAGRVMLHAAGLGFVHPATGKRVRWESPLPHDMAELIKRLRSEARA